MLSSFAVVPLAAFILDLGLLVVVLVGDFRSRINRTFAVHLLCMMTWSFASFAGRLHILFDDSLLWGKILASGCLGMPITFYHFVRVYLGIRENRWRLRLGYALYVGCVVLTFATTWIIAGARVVDHKYFLQQGPGTFTLAIAYAITYVALAISALRCRYTETRDPDLRSRIRYLWIGTAYVIVGLAANQVPALRVYPLDIAANAVNVLILTYCILRYQLIDITPRLRVALSYFVLTALVGGGYLLNFLGLRRLVITYGVWVLWPVMLLFVLLLALPPPLRRMGRSLVDRLLFPQRYDVQRMLLRLAVKTGTLMELQSLTRLILDEVTTTMRIDSASLFLLDADTGNFSLVASKGLPPAATPAYLRPDHPVLVWLNRDRRALMRVDLDLQLRSHGLANAKISELDQLDVQLFVPLCVKGKLVGVFTFGPKTSGARYRSEDTMALTVLASQTAVAVENARLYATEQRRLKESLVLLDIAAAVSSTLDLTTVLQLIAQRTAEACAAYRCSVFMLDEQRQNILLLMSQFAAGGSETALWTNKFRHNTHVQSIAEVPLLVQLLSDRQPVVVDGATINTLPESWIAPFNICSALLVPLVSKDRVTGIMALDQVEPGKCFGQEHINLAMTIGSQVAAAIENAGLFDQLTRRAQRLTLLGQIASMAVTSILNLDAILRTAVESLSKAFDVVQGTVILFDEERSMGRLVAEYPSKSATDPATVPLHGNLTIERILVTKQPLVIEDALHDPLLTSVADLQRRRNNIQSILIVPLLLRGEVVGTIELDDGQEQRAFTLEEIDLAQTVANQISVAIENARLYEQMFESKARTEIILQETFSGLVVTDANLRIVSLNPGAEQITGCSAQEALGKRLIDVFGTAIAVRNSPLVKAIETGERVLPVETVLLGNGQSKDILLGVTPLPTLEGGEPHYLLSFSDISKLKEVDRLKSSIVANVSHELRTPLASIKVYTELLLGSIVDGDAEPQHEWLVVIDRETDRLTSLINDFLDLSRLEAGRSEIVRAPLHLEQLIEEVVALLQVQAERRHIRIELHYAPGVSELYADEDLLRTVIKNLVGNAIKFSHDKSTIRVSVWEDAATLRFCVADEGIGIPPDAIPHLFTKFFRVSSAATAGVQGTGLGLALANEAVAAHGGRIEVESALGQGSRFTVILPKGEGKHRLDKSASR